MVEETESSDKELKVYAYKTDFSYVHLDVKTSSTASFSNERGNPDPDYFLRICWVEKC